MAINRKIMDYLGQSPYADIIKQQQEAQDLGAQQAAELSSRPETDFNQYAALAKAAAQMGTLGGKAADTSAVQQAAQGYQGQADARRKELLAGIQNRVNDAEQTAGLNAKLYEYLTNKQEKQADRQERAKEKAEENAYRNAALGLKAQTMQAKGGGLSLTKGEEAADKAFAEKNADFLTGGRVKSQASLDQLNKVLKQMDETESGPYTALGTVGPKWAGWVGDSKAAEVFDKLKTQALSSAKETLTGTMSDKDIEMLVDAAFNPNLPMEANKEKVKELKHRIEETLKTKKAAADFFKRRGSIKGYVEPEALPPPEDDDLAAAKKLSNQSAPSAQTVRILKDGVIHKIPKALASEALADDPSAKLLDEGGR